MIAYELIELFEAAPRLGAETDMPEGARYIQISDTLAKRIAASLRKLAADLEQKRAVAQRM